MGMMKKGSPSSPLQQSLFPWHCLRSSPSSSTKSNDSSSSNNKNTVRVIAPDGGVKVFKGPVAAAEVMRQHPLHLICRSDSFFIGQKVPPLSASDHLQPGHSYFLLPSHFFHSVLSFVTLSSSLLLLNTNTNNKKPSAVPFQSFDIQRTEKGIMLQVKVKDEAVTNHNNNDYIDDKESKGSAICDSEELEKEYRQLVGFCKQWKPRLETISEISSGNGAKSLFLLLIGSRWRLGGRRSRSSLIS